uniref:Uncharacterized protein n=1 Tax=Vombatus ursinus TaxID=29139 RepID=A0A4X2L940_VOMUR
MLTSRKRGSVNLDIKKERFLTQKKRNTRLRSSARLIRKQWTLRSCPKSRKFLSSVAASFHYCLFFF